MGLLKIDLKRWSRHDWTKRPALQDHMDNVPPDGRQAIPFLHLSLCPNLPTPVSKPKLAMEDNNKTVVARLQAQYPKFSPTWPKNHQFALNYKLDTPKKTTRDNFALDFDQRHSNFWRRARKTQNGIECSMKSFLGDTTINPHMAENKTQPAPHHLCLLTLHN